MKLTVHTQLDEIDPDQWNRLVEDNNPLLRHEFLAAMEHHDCVGERLGWLPRHLALYDGTDLVAAMPLYEKHNSYGEFVFDHAWADFYQRQGLRYFPKLVSAVPYTPAQGQRLLCKPGREEECFPLLLSGVLQLAVQLGASGYHCLFPMAREQSFLQTQGLLARHDCQYHWHNEGYADFDGFLARLSAKKRKNIRQERSKVSNSGVKLRRLDGHTASEEDWRNFDRFYRQIYTEKWGIATFNLPFFLEIARHLPDRILLVLADLDDRCIAGSLLYHSDSVLYGRHWGCIDQVDSLHFEACYYQGIEYCIERKLRLFEPGAQGEHKIARGFRPTLTRSSHWIADTRLHPALRAFTEHERKAVTDYMRELEASLPYRAGD